MKRKFKKLSKYKKLKEINKTLTLEEFFIMGCVAIEEALEWWEDDSLTM